MTPTLQFMQTTANCDQVLHAAAQVPMASASMARTSRASPSRPLFPQVKDRKRHFAPPLSHDEGHVHCPQPS
jgi:hypothetical protein